MKLTIHQAYIIRSLRVNTKSSYAGIAEAISNGENPDYKFGEALCKAARKHYPNDSEEDWNTVKLSDDDDE